MSYKSKEAAHKAGLKTKFLLKKGKWKIRVHENLGWHCTLYWGFFGLSIYSEPLVLHRYMLLIGHGGTGISGLNSYHGNDPNKLIEQAIPECIKALKYWIDVADWLKTLQT